MRTIATMLLLIAAAFYAGASFRADRIQTTCESDDRPTLINGTEYVCLSQRHVEMLRQRQMQQSWRGA